MSRKRLALVVAGTLIVTAALIGGSPDEGTATTASPTAPSPMAADSQLPTPNPPASATPGAPSPAVPTTPTPTAEPTPSEAPSAPPVVALSGTVSEVVDGDTVRVELATGRETVRIIGIDTPEVVHPSQPEACFGAEATAFATRTLEGQPVSLELDPSQDERDRYDRLLAHVWVGDVLYASEAIGGGFGIHYIYEDPSVHAVEFGAAADAARTGGRGIWSRCDGRVDLPVDDGVVPEGDDSPDATSRPDPTVEAGCHPSYRPCVPDDAGDLDCGDIDFPVEVIGPDEYRFDGSDNDGRGCESN